MGCNGDCSSCSGSGGSSPMPQKGKNTLGRNDIDKDEIKMKCPTKGFRPGDKVINLSTGEEGEVVKCDWHTVWVNVNGKRVGFPPRFLKKEDCDCSDCSGGCNECSCK